MPRGRRRARGDCEAAARRLDQERRARRRVQHRQRSEVRRVVAGPRAALARARSPTGLARPGRLPHDMAALAPRGRRGILGGSVLVAVGIVFLVDPHRPAPLIPALLLALFAFLTLYGRGDLMPAWFQPMFVPLLFIALGVYLLLEKRT